MDNSWILEEEKLLELAENGYMCAENPTQLIVSFFYTTVADNGLGGGDSEIEQIVSEPLAVSNGILKWEDIRSLIRRNLRFRQKQYMFQEASLFYISGGIENMCIRDASFTPIVSGKDIHLLPSLPLFAEINELVVIMKESPPISTPKSILRKPGTRGLRTKRVSISIPSENAQHYRKGSRRVRINKTRKLRI